MRPLVATTDLGAIVHNYAVARRSAPGKQVFAVVKANAYGHGVLEVVTALRYEVDGFAVASLEEGTEVRALADRARILLLQGCSSADEMNLAARFGLDIVVHDERQARWLLEMPLEQPVNVWLKLDSGMHRLGLSVQALRDWYPRLKSLPSVAELNMLSHLACADERGHPMTESQLQCYQSVLDLDFSYRSLANSAAILTLPATHMDWVRAGLMLYGVSPLQDLGTAELGLRPALTLSARIIAIHDVQPGETVGYCADWTAARPSRIATVCCGYADGYPRSAQSGTPVWLEGQRVPVAGRVSMDMLGIDITDCPQAQLGSEVELFGRHLPVDEVARHCGTIAYELLTGIAGRVLRRSSFSD